MGAAFESVHLLEAGYYRPVSDVVTSYQQAVWSIMADVPRIGIKNPDVFYFGSMIRPHLVTKALQNLSQISCLFMEYIEDPPLWTL